MNVEIVPAGVNMRVPPSSSEPAVDQAPNDASAVNNAPCAERVEISPTAIAIGCIERAFDKLHTASTLFSRSLTPNLTVLSLAERCQPRQNGTYGVFHPPHPRTR